MLRRPAWVWSFSWRSSASLRAVEAPAVGAPYVAGTRRLLARRFPYAVVYRVRGEQVVEIVAVAHYRRRPGYWRRRL